VCRPVGNIAKKTRVSTSRADILAPHDAGPDLALTGQRGNIPRRERQDFTSELGNSAAMRSDPARASETCESCSSMRRGNQPRDSSSATKAHASRQAGELCRLPRWAIDAERGQGSAGVVAKGIHLGFVPGRG
jgi:hypothetical protein